MTGSKLLRTGLAKSKTFCALPWVSVTTDTDGSIRPCCISLDKITKKDQSFYNLGKDNIEDIINSDHFVQIREKMLNGEKVSGCENCYKQEENVGSSHRTYYNQVFPGKYTESFIHPNIKYADLRFGNLCNLKCRSCNSSASSSIAKEVIQLINTEIDRYHYSSDSNIEEWYTTDMFRSNTDKFMDTLEELYITGGEPTLVENNIDFLSMLVKQGKSHKIRIKINSNMTNINKSFYDLISQFRSTCFFASIDGYKEIQEYLRYPSNWNTIDTNLQKILDNPKMIVRPTPVVQIGNLNRLVDLFEYFESYNRKHKKGKIQIDPIMLEFPSYFDIKYLPTSYKEQCFRTIDDWVKTKCKYQSSQFHLKIQAIKNKCLTDAFDKDKLLEYKSFNDILDNHRNHYLKDVNLELYEMIKDI